MKRFGLILILSAVTALAQQGASPDQPPIEQLRSLAKVTLEEATLQANIDALRKKYRDSYPDIVAARANLEVLREQERALRQQMHAEARLADRWWKNAATVQSLGLTGDQQKKMDDVFQQYRLKLIDLNAVLEKEEVTLEPLMSSEPLDESKTAAQIDRVAQARAELEKSNGRMLLGIRKLLTPEQWSRLNASNFQASAQGSPVLKAGDSLLITGFASDVTATVKPDGTVVLPIAGALRAEGLTKLQFQEAAERAVSGYIKNPHITVRVFHRND
jgi:Spy/CpxP family protein refolding chaperone